MVNNIGEHMNTGSRGVPLLEGWRAGARMRGLYLLPLRSAQGPGCRDFITGTQGTVEKPPKKVSFPLFFAPKEKGCPAAWAGFTDTKNGMHPPQGEAPVYLCLPLEGKGDRLRWMRWKTGSPLTAALRQPTCPLAVPKTAIACRQAVLTAAPANAPFFCHRQQSRVLPISHLW